MMRSFLPPSLLSLARSGRTSESVFLERLQLLMREIRHCGVRAFRGRNKREKANFFDILYWIQMHFLSFD